MALLSESRNLAVRTLEKFRLWRLQNPVPARQTRGGTGG
jgi:hypothetical protein